MTDPRFIPNYTIAEVARYIDIPKARLREAAAGKRYLSFTDLTDLYRSTRTIHSTTLIMIDDEDQPAMLFLRGGPVTLDPHISFGLPHINGIRTDAIASRFRAGDTIAGLATDYNLEPDLIEEAIRFELIIAK